MSCSKWTPLRYVAESINAGDRSYFNLVKIPQIGVSQASDAISEMERKGVVVFAPGFRVEPTEAFRVWLDELRQRDDQTNVRQPAEQPKAVLLEAPPQAAPASTLTVKRKRYFAHLSRDPYEARLEMAARIKETMEAMNRRTMTVSALKRTLHADRHPEAWKEAIERLVVHRIAKIADGNITLKWSKFELPSPYGRPKPKRRRRNRGQSEWYQMNRTKMNDGQHSDFDEDWEDEDQDDEDDLAAEQAFWRQLDDIKPER